MRRIGPYEVLGLLGRGGMGAVYKVAMPVTGRIMALKLLSPSGFLAALVEPEELRRRFLAEAAALGGISHANVAGVWGFGQEGGRPYFLMEYYCRDLGQVIGETAEVEAPTRRLPLPRALRYAQQTLAGLARLHHAGIVHRDVKPFNLLITDEDQIKITDFGLSRVRGEALSTPPGLKIGSPYYAAPEQEDDPDAAGPKSDLYSAAVTIFRMLTGGLPAWPLVEDRLPSRLSKDLDKAWDDFFIRALDPDQRLRHRDALAMAAELRVLEQAWKERLTKACRLETRVEARPCETREALARPRGDPAKVTGRNAWEILGLDRLWRPKCYLAQKLTVEGGCVRDGRTGLVWQAGGSEYPVSWWEAHEYVAGLNATRFACERGWRLPTVEELASLLTEPPEFTGHCVSPVFETGKLLLWSADRRAYTQAWFADTGLGAFSWADMTCRRFVRAVRTG